MKNIIEHIVYTVSIFLIDVVLAKVSEGLDLLNRSIIEAENIGALDVGFAVFFKGAQMMTDRDKILENGKFVI